MADRARLNLYDRWRAWRDPSEGVRRLQARLILSQYEAATPSRRRKFSRDKSGPDRLTQRSAAALRDQVRHLERNSDIVKGALDTLVNNTVGAAGIGVEFQPRRMDGTIHTEYAEALAEAWRDWQRRPEVTWTHAWPKACRLVARTWYRDGEAFAQRVMGYVPYLRHGSAVPYSLELLEPDLVPLDYDDHARGIRQGVERDAWGRRRNFMVYRRHPGEFIAMPTTGDLKAIPADRMLQIAQLDRIGQLRGVTRFASAITRLEDIKDYEESERIAAKVAAMLTAFVKRQAPDGGGYEPEIDPKTGEAKPRDIALSPGTIIDTLAVGEEIGLVDSNRPNPNLITFRQGQLRAAAAGIGTSYSSLSKSYDGTYSSQRQELVEQYVHYACLTDDFVGMFVAPVVDDFITMADMSGVVPIPRDLRPGSFDDVLFVAPSMPWIDPLKEATAWLALVQAGFASEFEVMHKRGVKPSAVLAQIAEFRRMAGEKGLTFNSDPAAVAKISADLAEASREPERNETRAALRGLEQQLAVAATRGAAAAPAPNVNVQVDAPQITNQVQPSAPAAVHVDVAAPQVTNQVQPTPVAVHVDTPAPQVHVDVAPAAVTVQPVMAAPAVQVDVTLPDRKTEVVHERDAQGRITKSTSTETDA